MYIQKVMNKQKVDWKIFILLNEYNFSEVLIIHSNFFDILRTRCIVNSSLMLRYRVFEENIYLSQIIFINIIIFENKNVIFL